MGSGRSRRVARTRLRFTRGDARLEDHSSRTHLDDRERVHVAVRVDANHVVELICEHPTHLQPMLGDTLRCRSGVEDRGRQNCDESRRQAADRLLIRPASGRQVGTGLFTRTDHWKDTRRRGHSGIESQTKSTGATLTNSPRRDTRTLTVRECPLTGADLARRSQDVGLGHECPRIRSGSSWPVAKLRSLGATIRGSG
jgi:hypothetical protein